MAPCKHTAQPSWREGTFVRRAGLAQSRSECRNPRDVLGHREGGWSRAEGSGRTRRHEGMRRMKRLGAAESPGPLSATTAPPPTYKSICSSPAPRPTNTAMHGPPSPKAHAWRAPNRSQHLPLPLPRQMGDARAGGEQVLPCAPVSSSSSSGTPRPWVSLGIRHSPSHHQIPSVPHQLGLWLQPPLFSRGTEKGWLCTPQQQRVAAGHGQGT